jgi:hypothetical protein
MDKANIESRTSRDKPGKVQRSGNTSRKRTIIFAEKQNNKTKEKALIELKKRC